ncbi:hypothetical protein Hanom_Chr05g00429901 [Helianthus anomalus]
MKYEQNKTKHTPPPPHFHPTRRGVQNSILIRKIRNSTQFDYQFEFEFESSKSNTNL